MCLRQEAIEADSVWRSSFSMPPFQETTNWQQHIVKQQRAALVMDSRSSPMGSGLIAVTGTIHIILGTTATFAKRFEMAILPSHGIASVLANHPMETLSMKSRSTSKSPLSKQ